MLCTQNIHLTPVQYNQDPTFQLHEERETALCLERSVSKGGHSLFTYLSEYQAA